jgi:NAD(P)-dependent dehydrogenase (short-subunit alcohol dehydrogenase family)
MRFEGRSVIVTGGGSGLGKVAAQMFAAEGAKVLVADVVADRAQEAADEIRAAGGTASATFADVSKEDSVAAMVDKAVADFGGLDVMYANAGVAERGMGQIPLEEMKLEDWQFCIDVDLTGAFLSTKHAVRAMKARHRGSIVVCSSAAALATYPGWIAYTAAKHGVTGLVKAAAVSAGRHGIRVNAVCPAHGMSTGFLSGQSSTTSHEEAGGAWDPWRTEIPLKLDRAPNLRDTANLVLYLASDESEYMSGVSIPVTDGGTLGRVALTIPSHADVRPTD